MNLGVCQKGKCKLTRGAAPTNGPSAALIRPNRMPRVSLLGFSLAIKVL